MESVVPMRRSAHDISFTGFGPGTHGAKFRQSDPTTFRLSVPTAVPCPFQASVRPAYGRQIRTPPPFFAVAANGVVRSTAPCGHVIPKVFPQYTPIPPSLEPSDTATAALSRLILLVDSRPSSTDEKATVIDEPRSKGFFSRKKAAAKDVKDENNEGDVSMEVKPVEREIPAISFTELFRYSTKFELFLDFIGLVAAGAAGAAQPLMSLLFGNLTQDFVNFTQIVVNPARSSEIPEAGANFQHSAGKNATYLVCIGIGMFVCTYTYMCIWRLSKNAILRPMSAPEGSQFVYKQIHQGISEKVAFAVSFIGAFICGFALAYVRSWRLALAMSAMLPVMAILVSQEPTLFATTIGGNVAHGLIGTKHEHASDEEKEVLIKKACIKANADGFITKLPLGYDTMMKPPVLWTPNQKGVVQAALDKAAAGRTTITIAHLRYTFGIAFSVCAVFAFTQFLGMDESGIGTIGLKEVVMTPRFENLTFTNDADVIYVMTSASLMSSRMSGV
ncbi:hypothetical protein BDZ97DRAFT_1931229 [Flammula alnicola]|nr:hypothetical protein BDZ97DRAFT_1931229 [Flammula alnicola]